MENCINDYLLNYRNIPHSMTGVTPNELMGLDDNSSMDSLPTIIKPDHDSKSKKAMKEYTDKKRRAKKHDFKLDDLVVHKWSRSNK